MNKYIYLIIILILSSTHIYAHNYFNEQLALANKGNPEAQINIGKIYANGLLDVPSDAKKAFEWYSKAANQGLADGQYHLGRMYADGLGIKQDKNLALQWLKKAADQGDISAISEIEEIEEIEEIK